MSRDWRSNKEKVERLAAAEPAATSEAFGTFALAAHLADLAIEAALELMNRGARLEESETVGRTFPHQYKNTQGSIAASHALWRPVSTAQAA